MKSKNGIHHDYKKAIKNPTTGAVRGWQLYTRNKHLGFLFQDKFVGYLWKTKTGNADIIK